MDDMKGMFNEMFENLRANQQQMLDAMRIEMQNELQVLHNRMDQQQINDSNEPEDTREARQAAPLGSLAPQRAEDRAGVGVSPTQQTQ